MIYVYIELFLFVFLVIGSPIELILHYWALMNAARLRDDPSPKLSKLATWIGSYLLIRGYLLDFIVNTVWMTIYLQEWPQEMTVTKRINRHTATGSGKRYDRCQRIQTDLLRWFDTKHADGIHR